MKKHILILSSALLCISAFAQVPNYVPTNGLVGYWPFNGNANDESGNGNNGTVNGATLTTDRFGVANKAYSFDGNDFIESTVSNLPLANSPRSVSLWCNLSSSNSNWTSLFSYGNGIGTADSRKLYDLFIKDGSPQFYINNNELGNVSGNLSSFNNVWTNLTLVYDGSNINGGYNLYINGAPISLSSFSYISSNDLITTISNLFFGKTSMSYSGQNFYFNGKLDDIGIWNRALTQCEIQDLYHAQLNSAAGINAGPDQTVCEGEFITLNGSGGTNYVWNNSVVDGVPFIPTASMDYPVLGQDANGCIGTDTMHVELIPTSSSTLTETALDSYTLNGQTYTQSGTYTQVIPNAAGCDSTITLNLSLDFTGISELNKEFRIAPNPATDQLIISTSTLSNEKYILFDPQGRKVLSGSLTGTTTQLDLSKLARGNYLLQIGEKLTPVKLVKE